MSRGGLHAAVDEQGLHEKPVQKIAVKLNITPRADCHQRQVEFGLSPGTVTVIIHIDTR